MRSRAQCLLKLSRPGRRRSSYPVVHQVFLAPVQRLRPQCRLRSRRFVSSGTISSPPGIARRTLKGQTKDARPLVSRSARRQRVRLLVLSHNNHHVAPCAIGRNILRPFASRAHQRNAGPAYQRLKTSDDKSAEREAASRSLYRVVLSTGSSS